MRPFAAVAMLLAAFVLAGCAESVAGYSATYSGSGTLPVTAGPPGGARLRIDQAAGVVYQSCDGRGTPTAAPRRNSR